MEFQSRQPRESERTATQPLVSSCVSAQAWFSSLLPISIGLDLVLPVLVAPPNPLVVQLHAHRRRRCLFVDLALALSAALALITGAF